MVKFCCTMCENEWKSADYHFWLMSMLYLNVYWCAMLVVVERWIHYRDKGNWNWFCFAIFLLWLTNTKRRECLKLISLLSKYLYYHNNHIFNTGRFICKKTTNLSMTNTSSNVLPCNNCIFRNTARLLENTENRAILNLANLKY